MRTSNRKKGKTISKKVNEGTKINYMKKNRITQFLAIALVAMLYACGTPKDIEYFQDSAWLNGMAVQAEQQLRLRPEDKINIVVNSSNPMLEKQFTLTTLSPNYMLGSSVTPQTTSGKNNASYGQMVAYTVDEQGTINFPVLGKISVGGKTRKEVAQYIQSRLIARELVSDPIVTVEYVNMGINVLGEVNKAGHQDITKDHFTVIDALSYAGDLTINGNRRKVLVTRQVDGENHVYQLDLTNMQSVLNSPAYYLQQNDLVYVAPSNKRKREADATGNTFNNPSVWISIASLLTTITALIIK